MLVTTPSSTPFPAQPNGFILWLLRHELPQRLRAVVQQNATGFHTATRGSVVQGSPAIAASPVASRG